MKPDLTKLMQNLQELHHELRKETLSKYNRINPFCEDLFSWQERGDIASKKSAANITVYNSTTVVGKVEIGDHTWIGPFCSLDGGKIGLMIGANCSISTACHLLTHDTVKWALSMGKLVAETAPTSIGDGCFIGTGSIVTKGVTLGQSCLVAAGSVVTKSFEDCSIIGGVPAKLIGKVIVLENDVKFEYF